MLYGIKDKVDYLLRDMQAQKFKLPYTDKKGKEGYVWVQGSLRLLPFGIYEYVFPKESKEDVLTTLKFNNPSYPQYKKKINPVLTMIRKALSIKKIPKYEEGNNLLWSIQDVSIIPVGIREDKMITFKQNGLTHEGL